MASVVDPFIGVIYDGNTSSSDFERSFRIQALINDWDGNKQKASIAFFLKGKASRVYAAIVDKSSIDRIFTGLALGCAMPADVALRQFRARKRIKGEVISRYAQVLQDLLAIAMPGLDELIMNRLVIEQICENVPDHVRSLVEFRDKMAYDDLLSALDKATAGQTSGLSQAGPYINPIVEPEAVDTYYASIGKVDSSQNRLQHRGTLNGGKSVGNVFGDINRSQVRGSNWSQQELYGGGQNRTRFREERGSVRGNMGPHSRVSSMNTILSDGLPLANSSLNERGQLDQSLFLQQQFLHNQEALFDLSQRLHQQVLDSQNSIQCENSSFNNGSLMIERDGFEDVEHEFNEAFAESYSSEAITATMGENSEGKEK